MRHKFILPSCDYNIVLTEEDAEQLIKTGSVFFRTIHSIEVIDYDENGKIRDPGILLCRNCKDNKDWGVQFVRVVVPEYRKKYKEEKDAETN